MIDKELLEILVCPQCKGSLEYDAKASELICSVDHLAFAIRFCNLCKHCAVEDEKPCINPQKVRPCEAIFGIDVYETAKIHDLPCYPLQNKDDIQNRFGFVCIS